MVQGPSVFYWYLSLYVSLRRVTVLCYFTFCSKELMMIHKNLENKQDTEAKD